MVWLRLLVSVSLLAPVAAGAAEIEKVKSNKVMIKMDGEPMNKGDMYFVVDASNKKIGLIKIVSTKDDKSFGLVVKGRAEPGLQVVKRAAPTKTSGKMPLTEKAEAVNTAFWGVTLGYSMNSMTVKPSGITVNMAGSGFSGKLLVDYGVLDRLWFRGMFGAEQFAAGSSTSCGTAACSVTILYLNADFRGRYIFSLGQWRPWIGGGFSLYFPMTKTVTAIQEGSVTNTSVIAGSAGVDFMVNPKMAIPIMLEYGFFPSSQDVTASSILLRGGIAWAF